MACAAAVDAAAPDGQPTALVLATHNLGKLAELQRLLGGLDVRLLPQPDLGIAAADEPHATFVENALAKARHAARASGRPALADDSGLCVDALGGAPGVRSARYAALSGAPPGHPAVAPTDDENIRLLLRRLHGLAPAERAARFVCVLVAVRSADDPEPLIAQGRWHGRIATAARGTGGFGYDPVFDVASSGCTAAELSPVEKNRSSHRAAAVRELIGLLRSVWAVGPSPAVQTPS